MHAYALPRLTAILLLLAACGSTGASTASDDTSPAAAADSKARDTVDSPIPSIDIDYEKYVLDNGLTLIVHEDHSTPIVAVHMWYHVGSRNEGTGQHGFAHLFEHLMYQGTEHWDGEYFEPFESAGATNMNGTTGPDRTNYYATVPTPALDMALWMESDRMGHLLGGIGEAELDEQVGVVLNEKRQRGNQPYVEAWWALPANTYPGNHPYSWPTIGSKKDLQAATLDDVQEWFRTYYGPNNATLVLAGDIDPDAARDKVEHYFGSIPAGPPLSQQQRWIAPMQGEHRMIMHDRVPHARLYLVWNVPPRDSADTIQLELAGDLLTGAKTALLYKKLVYDEQIALDVSAGVVNRQLGSQFIISATAKADTSLDELEDRITDILRDFHNNGPATEAMQRSKMRIGADFMRSLESADGKARQLASGEIYHNDPAHYEQELDALRTATAVTVRNAVNKWLSGGHFVLSVLPYGKHATHDTDVDRSQLPDIGATPDLDLPPVQTATLSNGLEIQLAEKHAIPTVRLDMLFDAGYAADPAAQPGLAGLTLAMLDEGTEQRSALEISAALDSAGATFSTHSSLDASIAGMSALSSRLPDSLALFADILQQPAFPKDNLQRLRKQKLATIEEEKNSPMSLGLRKIGPLLYGNDHPYGIPLTGSGTTEAVQAMTRDDLLNFYHRWLRPDNATLVVVGDTTMAEIKPLLERHFGGWQSPADTPLPAKDISTVAPPEQTRIFLVDRPGATQSTIIAGNLAPARTQPAKFAMTAVNAILGGMFNSRLNLLLREQKHWSYGAGSSLTKTRAQRPFFAYTSAQVDKTVPAIKAIRDQIRRIRGDKPPTSEELDMAAANLTRSLTGANETTRELARTLADSIIHNLPADYYEQYVGRIQSLTVDDLPAAARRLLKPDAMTWVVVGDLDQIGDAVRELGWAKVKTLAEHPQQVK